MELEAHELAAIKREKQVEMNLKQLEVEAANCSSGSSLSCVSSSVRAEDKIKNWVNSPSDNCGSTGDPPATAAPLTTNAQQTCYSGGNTSSTARTHDVKLDVSQFNVALEKTIGLIHDPNKSFLPSSRVRKPAASSAPAPQNQSMLKLR